MKTAAKKSYVINLAFLNDENKNEIEEAPIDRGANLWPLKAWYGVGHPEEIYALPTCFF